MKRPERSIPCLAPHLSDVFAARRGEVALRLPGSSYRYGELLDATRRAVAWLRECGIRPGDRIAVEMNSSVESVLLYLGALFSGTILVPLNPRYTREEIRYFLEDAEAGLYLAPNEPACTTPGSAWRICRRGAGGDDLPETGEVGSLLGRIDRALPDELRSWPRPHDLALLCYTSGTTGKPKGAMITHGNLAAMAAGLHLAWGWTHKDVLLHTLPLFHVHGLLVALQGALFAGASTVLLPRFEPEEVLARLSGDHCTLFMGVPTMYRRFVSVRLASNPSLAGMRLFVSGSAPLPPEVFHAFRERFGHTILERYGMTEAGMVLSNPLHGERRPGSVGFPLPGVSVRIVDPETGTDLPAGETGEVLIRSGSVCKGYWKRPEATREAFTADGWLRSGDMARQDPDGYFYLVGRRKEIIITGGFNVYPKEVESVLERHPAVKEAAVFGCPDPDLGEKVCAAVVLEGDTGATEEALIRACKASLAAYKCPRAIYTLEELPRNPMGKVVKADLRALCPRIPDTR